MATASVVSPQLISGNRVVPRGGPGCIGNPVDRGGLRAPVAANSPQAMPQMTVIIPLDRSYEHVAPEGHDLRGTVAEDLLSMSGRGAFSRGDRPCRAAHGCRV